MHISDMYNQVSRGPNFGPGGSHPPPAAPPPLQQLAYQQQAHPPPPPHFQHAYLHGPPNASSIGATASLPFQAPHGVVVQSSGQYGKAMAQQNFASRAQSSSHSSNLGGVQSLHAHPPVLPPPVGHSQQEMSWPPGPPSRVLPPPPLASTQRQVLYKPPFIPAPPQPGGSQNVQHSHNTLPPPPPLPGGFLHSNAGNYQVPSVASPPPPPLPSCPPPILPSPPPPTPPMTSAFPNAVHCDPKSGKVSGSEYKASDSVDKFVSSYSSGIAPVHNSDPNQDSGSWKEVVAADRDDQFSTRHENKSEPQLWPQAADSTEPWYQLHVATESADSDMEMEDDITLSDKDQGPNYAIDAQNQQCHQVGEEFSIDENVHQLQNSKENDPAKDILSSGTSCFGSSGVSKKHEGLGHLFDLGDKKSAGSVAKDNSPVNNSSELNEFPPGTVSENSAAPQNGPSDLIEDTNPDRDSGQIIRSGSPIRLLQDYASDDTSDDEETCGTDVNILTASARAAAGFSVSHKDSGSYLENDIGSKSPSSTQKGFGQLSKIALNDSEISPHLEQESRQCFEDNHENQVSVAASIEAFQGKEALGGTSIESGSKSGNAEQEHVRKGSKFEANVLEVDEFGRHPREAPTDSDSESDDSHYRQTRRVNKRGRSRSKSPLDRSRNRRRKSPRRRSKRSWSRSWSPRHRRSRSRSPIFKRTGDFGGENMRRDRGQCFNFLRGKCYRGSSCRYIHHESDKNASSRHSRNKHDQEVDSRAKNSRMNKSMKNISPEVSDHERDGIRNKHVDDYQNVTGQAEKRKEVSVKPAVVSSTSDIESQLVRNDPMKYERFRGAAPEMQETILLREEPNKAIHENDSLQKVANVHPQQVVDGICPEASGSGDAFKPSSGTYKDMISPEDSSFVHQFQPNFSIGVSEHTGNASQLKNASIVSDSSSDKISMISAGANQASSCEPSPFMLPSTQPLSATSSVGPWLSSEQPLLLSQAVKEFTPHHSSSAQLPLHAYQFPPLPVVSYGQNENAMHLPQSSRDYGVTQQSASFPFQSTTREKIEPYPAPLHTQNPQFTVPPNYSWASLPPPPPPPPSQAVYNSSLNSGVTKSFVSSEFNQSQLHSRADFVSQTSDMPGLPSHSETLEFQTQAYPPIQDHSRSFVPTEAFSPKHLPQGNPASQLLSGPNLSREDLYKQFPLQDSKLSSSAGLHPQQQQYSWQSDANRQQPSFGGKLPQEDHFKLSSHIHPSAQKQQSIYNFQYSASEGNLGVPGETGTISRYPPDVLDSNHSTSLPAFGGSRIPAHYNPYASTFEQPLSSKFSLSTFRQESEIIHGKSYGSYRLNPTISRKGIDGVGSRQLVSSPKSARAVGQNPRSSDKQYDPLFDSIEPKSSLKKFDFEQKQEVTGESNISLRPKSPCMSLDLEEQNKQEEVGAVASTTSQNNDEYGETEDAEVGDVENESLSNHFDIANLSPGEVEINQIKSPGKRKRSKDSRSMKLFKVSIANFVKEVLKPSWRQGNMSKVAFKTIVKKTVDKVSGAMKGHRIPKSQAKISQYIDSSQRKLTKLVMGYVEKYVKV